VVAPPEFTGPLQGKQITGIGNNTDQTVAPLQVPADLTLRVRRQVKTGLALTHLGPGRQ